MNATVKNMDLAVIFGAEISVNIDVDPALALACFAF